jgi:pre-mRNA cleavage complex 2 protein Pcf11
VHRSAYLDELVSMLLQILRPLTKRKQWSQLQEQDGEEMTSISSPNSKAAKKAEEQFVPAPTDVSLLKLPCSICMEPFKSVWHDKSNQPVWMDAVKVGSKYFHASCFEDLNRGKVVSPSGRKGRGMGTGTPDPVLGKRKYEGRV